MEKRYIVSSYTNTDEIFEAIEENYTLLRAPEDSIGTGDLFEITIKKIGVVRHKIEVELDSSES